MANSRRFRILEKRLDELHSGILPKVNPSGSYTSRELDCVRAYRILTHAEIEYFLEELTKDIIAKAIRHYNAAKKPNRILKALRQTFSTRIELTAATTDPYTEAAGQQQKSIKSNHGLKEQNIRSLFLPLGLDYTLLDTTWLGVMNSFGENRGKAAHSSFRVYTIPDPVSEHNQILQVRNGLAKLDENLVSLRNCV
jgi:hypothetical protein